MVVTEAGLTPRSLATCTREISPEARTRSKTCWRIGRSDSDHGAISGPQPLWAWSTPFYLICVRTFVHQPK